MHPLITKLTIPLSGNPIAQYILRKIVFSQFLHYLVGIGAGASPVASGEKVLFKMLKQRYIEGKPLCIFDVGANHGLFVNMVEKSLNEKDIPFQIHAFEPSYYNYELLCDSSREYENIVLNNIALGKHQGEAELYYEREGSWLASLSKRHLDHVGIDFKYTEIIKINTLDDYCLNSNIQQIDLLKLDVEGHELDVLQGAIEMLKSKKIKLLSFEFGSCNIDSRTYFRDIFYFLKNHQMGNIFRITPSGYLSPIKEYQEIYEQFCTTNFIALH